MGVISETMRCKACEHTYEDLLDRDRRDDAYGCPECGEQESYRTFSVPNIRTAKLSASFVDGTKRFDKLREQQILKKEKAVAREHNDRASEKKVQQEITKLRNTQ